MSGGVFIYYSITKCESGFGIKLRLSDLHLKKVCSSKKVGLTSIYKEKLTEREGKREREIVKEFL